MYVRRSGGYVRAQGGVHRYGCVCERSRRTRDTLAYRVVYMVMDVCEEEWWIC